MIPHATPRGALQGPFSTAEPKASANANKERRWRGPSAQRERRLCHRA
jgi:hypothetical protein